jgi:hypothetical protein
MIIFVVFINWLIYYYILFVSSHTLLRKTNNTMYLNLHFRRLRILRACHLYLCSYMCRNVTAGKSLTFRILIFKTCTRKSRFFSILKKMDRNKHLKEFISTCTSEYLGIITRLMLNGVKLDSKKFCTEALKTYFMCNIQAFFVVFPDFPDN